MTAVAAEISPVVLSCSATIREAGGRKIESTFEKKQKKKKEKGKKTTLGLA